MKIISWNVNGLRAIYKKGHWQWLVENTPDIICIQETKSSPEQLPPELKIPLGYYSYFSSPRDKKGYSGVAIYSKEKPLSVSDNLWGDSEGRILEAIYPTFTLYNVYFPNGGGGPERLAYKLDFYEKFLDYIEKVRKRGNPIIFCGDVNTAHKEIDLARPKENERNTGFLPEERAWIDGVISKGYIDVFRHFYPDKTGAYTYWDMKTFARDRNVGWRIDYLFTSSELKKWLKSTRILDDIFGSDHCPLELELAI
ncbi:exodeoxyribonuclease III [Patescibacteria group bacterium]|nr:MAG: exodeoxyribonuclease III [Patescibacteria group bacterium]